MKYFENIIPGLTEPDGLWGQLPPPAPSRSWQYPKAKLSLHKALLFLWALCLQVFGPSYGPARGPQGPQTSMSSLEHKTNLPKLITRLFFQICHDHTCNFFPKVSTFCSLVPSFDWCVYTFCTGSNRILKIFDFRTVSCFWFLTRNAYLYHFGCGVQAR